jgi:1-acyl-sn-glycerol-3-phosphate acyltransferase
MSTPYRLLRIVCRLVLFGLARVRVEGLSHIPRRGPFILAPNHQSALDFLLVQGVFPGEVHTMTKSTQFASGLLRPLLLLGKAFPVRRYRVDAQAVRVLLRRLEEGRVVCVYPEGERSWDGRIQPLRRGTLHVFLRSGVPIVPVGIQGMYDLWPRWTRRPRWRTPVTIRFGEPITFGPHPNRTARKRALPEAERRLHHALFHLSGQAEDEEAEEGAAGGKGHGGPTAPPPDGPDSIPDRGSRNSFRRAVGGEG